MHAGLEMWKSGQVATEPVSTATSDTSRRTRRNNMLKRLSLIRALEVLREVTLGRRALADGCVKIRTTVQALSGRPRATFVRAAAAAPAAPGWLAPWRRRASPRSCAPPGVAPTAPPAA